MIKVNQDGETRWEYFLNLFYIHADKLEELIQSDEADKNDQDRYWVYQEIMDMIDEAETDFVNNLRVDPDPMLDPQLG
jgi:Fe-S cluster assembly iron-binding protein IscA